MVFSRSASGRSLSLLWSSVIRVRLMVVLWSSYVRLMFVLWSSHGLTMVFLGLPYVDPYDRVGGSHPGGVTNTKGGTSQAQTSPREQICVAAHREWRGPSSTTSRPWQRPWCCARSALSRACSGRVICAYAHARWSHRAQVLVEICGPALTDAHTRGCTHVLRVFGGMAVGSARAGALMDRASIRPRARRGPGRSRASAPRGVRAP